MKLLTFYSDSHKEMYERYFLPSFNKHLNGYDLQARHIEQISPTGDYKSRGWDLTMLAKLEHIIDSIDLSEEPFVYADCDVQFFGDIWHDLGSMDIMFQQDYLPNNYCAGFFIAKQSQKVIDFFTLARDVLAEKLDGTTEDQTVVNELIQSGYPIKCAMLPHEKYWTSAFATNGTLWNGQQIEVPKTIVMHHANFTIGVQNKLSLLEQVKSKRL